MSIGSRDVTVNRTTSTVERSEGIKRPLMDINMTLVEDKVYVKDETVSVMGVMRHMNKSRGEGRTTNIRWKVKHATNTHPCFFPDLSFLSGCPLIRIKTHANGTSHPLEKLEIVRWDSMIPAQLLST